MDTIFNVTIINQSPLSLSVITMMFSLDGESFTKFSGNPVIPKPEEWKDFRDPKVKIVFFVEDQQEISMP